MSEKLYVPRFLPTRPGSPVKMLWDSWVTTRRSGEEIVKRHKRRMKRRGKIRRADYLRKKARGIGVVLTLDQALCAMRPYDHLGADVHDALKAAVWFASECEDWGVQIPARIKDPEWWYAATCRKYAGHYGTSQMNDNLLQALRIARTLQQMMG